MPVQTKQKSKMETKESKSINYYMRVFHRYIGLFIVGFTIIYSLSGIILIYRDSDFLKREKTVKTTLEPGLKPEQIGQALRMRDLKVTETNGDIISFAGGTFNSATGEAVYQVKDLMFPFNKLTNLHKTPSKNPMHWFNLAFGLMMLFLAVSSFWMYPVKSKLFRTAIITIASGLIFAFVMLLLIK